MSTRRTRKRASLKPTRAHGAAKSRKRGRGAAKTPKRAGARRGARKAGRAAPKAARGGPATRPGARLRASRRAKPRLTVVKSRGARRPKPAAPAPPAFPQRAGASAKQLVLFEMVRARAAVLSAVQGLSAAAAGEPMAVGKWSARETVLHLVTRDQARLREMEAALRGVKPSWQGVHDPQMARINAETLGPLRHLDWEETLRLLHRTRQQLMEEVEGVPEEPIEVWSPEHPFGWMLHALPPHDRHHAEIIKRWRATRGA